jgi:hypothetical protein
MHDANNPVLDADEPREPQESPDPRRWKALAVISVAQFMEYRNGTRNPSP